MKIINEAQKQISLKQTSDKHEKFIFHMKNKLLGICMFLSKTNNMHTYPKHKKSLWYDLHEGKRLKRHTCIFIRFDYKIHIHEAKHENWQNKCKQN